MAYKVGQLQLARAPAHYIDVPAHGGTVSQRMTLDDGHTEPRLEKVRLAEIESCKPPC